jgi:hypothetical protein
MVPRPEYKHLASGTRVLRNPQLAVKDLKVNF